MNKTMCQALFKKITANMFSGGGSRINWEEHSKEHRGRLQTQREGRQWHPNYKVYIYCGVGYNYTVRGTWQRGLQTARLCSGSPLDGSVNQIKNLQQTQACKL